MTPLLRSSTKGLIHQWSNLDRLHRRVGRSLMSLLRLTRFALRTPLARRASTNAYMLRSHGDAASVLSLEKGETPGSARGDDLRVKWLAAGIDNLDLAAVRGESAAAGFAPLTLPGIPGSEGVAVVEQVGPDVSSIKNGDYVIPAKCSVGTWCETGIVSESQVVPVPNTMRLELAATLSTSAFTALRLLSDFGSLSAGELIVQNDGSSAIGTAIVQIASAMGLKTVSLVSESTADYAPTVERLKLMGGDVVVGESYAESAGFKAVMADMPTPKLGLNSGDKKSCTLLASLVGEGGTIVSHSMGIADASAIKANGQSKASFSLPAWLERSPRQDIEEMVSTLTGLIESGKLTAWLQRVKFEELPLAIETGSITRRKLVALMPAAESHA